MVGGMKLTAEMVFNKKHFDQSSIALDVEIDLFLSYLIESDKITRIGKNIYFDSSKKIALRGDNLVTRKQMYIRMFSREKYLKEKIENDQHIYSYMLIPHNSADGRCQLNSKRASVYGYNDNPFVFLRTLQKIYESGFNVDEGKDKVEEEILSENNRKFWKLFGEGKAGFDKFLYIFCLNCYYSLYKNSKYEKFFQKETEYKEGDWETYEMLLKDFMDLRKKEIKERLDKIDNSNDKK